MVDPFAALFGDVPKETKETKAAAVPNAPSAPSRAAVKQNKPGGTNSSPARECGRKVEDGLQ